MLTTIKLYAELAVAAAVLGLVVFAGWQYDQAKLARKDTAAAVEAMTQLQRGLDSLQAGQRADSAAIQAMAASQAVVSQHAAVVARRVVTMGNSDAKVQTWLDAAVPGTGCLLDDTCPASGAVSATVGGTSAPVR